MFFRVLWFFILLIAVAVGVDLLAQAPGVLKAEWYGWQVQTTAAFAAVVIAATLFVAILLLRAFWWVDALPKRLRARLEARHKEGGLVAVEQALQALMVQDDTKALMYAEKAKKVLPEAKATQALLGYVYTKNLQAGKASQRAAAYFGAHLQNEATEQMALSGLLQLSLINNESKEALTYVRELALKNPKDRNTLNTLAILSLKEGFFEEALKAAQSLQKLCIKDPKAQRFATEQFAFMLLYTAEKVWLQTQTKPKEEQQKGAEQAETYAQKALSLIPSFAPAALFLDEVYQKQFRMGAEKALKKAQHVLKETYKRGPAPELAEAFLKGLTSLKAEQKLKEVKAFIRPWPEATASFAILAKVYLLKGDMQAAYKTLDEGLLKGGSRYLFEVFAEFEKQQNPNGNGAIRWLKQALNAPVQEDIKSYIGPYKAWQHQLVMGKTLSNFGGHQRLEEPLRELLLLEGK